MIKIDQELKIMLKTPYLNKLKMHELIKKYKFSRNPEKKLKYRDEIFYNNIRFIRKIVANKIHGFQDKMEDVFNSATIAFFDGLDHYKISKKTAFSTYIHYYIMNAIYKSYIAENIIHIPSSIYFNESQDIKSARNASLVYFDKEIVNQDGEKTNKHESIPDKRYDSFEENITNEVLVEQVRNIIDKFLNDKERVSLYLKYAFEESLTLVEIGKFLGISREKVRQHEYMALFKTRMFFKDPEALDKRFPKKKGLLNKITFKEIQDFYEKTIKSRCFVE